MPPTHLDGAAPAGPTSALEQLGFAFVRFDGAGTAASRFAAACERCGGVPWLREVGVVQRHRDGHLVIRGSFAGRYVDLDESDHVSEPGGQRDALIGGVVEVLLEPPGIAVGLMLGGAVGCEAAAPTEAEREGSALAERLRARLAPGTSSLLMLAGPVEVAEILDATGPGAAEVRQGTLSTDSKEALVAEMDAAMAATMARPPRQTLALAVDH